MNSARYSSFVAILVAVLTSYNAYAQIVSRPYDADAVRAASVKIRQLIDHPELREGLEGGVELFEPLQFIGESLRDVRDLAVVPDEVLHSIVALTGCGRVANVMLLRFGDRAVAPLIRSASLQRPFCGRGGPMGALSEILETPDAERMLSQSSHRAIQKFTRDMLADRTLEWGDLSNACDLAIATRDPELRATALRLTEPRELTARGIKPEYQRMIVADVQRALAKSRPR